MIYIFPNRQVQLDNNHVTFTTYNNISNNDTSTIMPQPTNDDPDTADVIIVSTVIVLVIVCFLYLLCKCSSCGHSDTDILFHDDEGMYDTDNLHFMIELGEIVPDMRNNNNNTEDADTIDITMGSVDITIEDDEISDQDNNTNDTTESTSSVNHGRQL